MDLRMKVSSVRVLRASNGKSANSVLIDGSTRLNVWPRDVSAFKAAVAEGEISVSAKATFQYDKEGEDLGTAKKVRTAEDGATPLLRVEYSFVSANGDLGTLVTEAPPPALVGDAGEG